MNLHKHKYTLILAAGVLVIISCYAFFFSIVTTRGYMIIQDKEIIEDKYYIYLDNNYNGKENITQIEITKKQYDRISLYERVEISYKSSKFMSGKGKLIYLNFNNTMDSKE